MSDFHDLLQCPMCGAFYTPEFSADGRSLPHCLPVANTVKEVYSPIIEADYGFIERRVVNYLLTEPK